jgi:hypothetical protein
MAIQFNTGRGDSTAVADRLRAVPITDDGSTQTAGIAVATGAPLTMACWLKPPNWNLGTSILQSYMCVYNRPASQVTNKYIYEIQAIGLGTSAASLSFRMRTVTGATQVNVAYTQTGTAGDIIHIAAKWIRRTGDTNRLDRYLYINGTQVNSSTASTVNRPELTASMNQTMIGAGGAVYTGNSGIDGQENRCNDEIAEAAIWETGLDDAEIASLAKGFRPSLIRPSQLKLYVPGVRGWSANVCKNVASPPAKGKMAADSTPTTVAHYIHRIG